MGRMRMEEVHHERVRGRDGRMHDVVTVEVEPPRGRVSVEIADERTGKVSQRHEGENFISKMYGYHVRSMQRLFWQAPYRYNAQGLAVSYDLSLGQMFGFPDGCVALWNDDSAEAPSTETRVKTDAAGVVAWASKWPCGAPANKRGAINVTESYVNGDVELRVHDWPTSAGNGEFQSIGLTGLRVNRSSAQYRTGACLLIRPNPADRRVVTPTLSLNDALVAGGATGSMAAGSYPSTALSIIGKVDGYVYDGRIYFNNVATTNNFFNLASVPVPAASPNSIGVTDVSSPWQIHMVNIAPTSRTTATVSNGINRHGFRIAGTHGPNWVIMYRNTSLIASFCLVNRSTGALSKYTVTAQPAETIGERHPVGVMIGDNLWITTASITGPVLERYDVSVTTPVLNASLTLPATIAGNVTGPVLDITTDGTDLWIEFQDAGWWRLDTSGNAREHYGSDQTGGIGSEPSAPPYTGQVMNPTMPMGLNHNHDGNVPGRYASNNLNSGNSINGYGDQNLIQPRPDLFGAAGWGNNTVGRAQWIGGELVRLGMAGPGTVRVSYEPLGFNLGSRILLPSPFVKNSSQTMKVAYEFTFPSLVV